MAFGIRKFAVRVQRQNASARRPVHNTLIQQHRIGAGVKAPKSAKKAEDRLKNLLRGSKLKRGLKH